MFTGSKCIRYLDLDNRLADRDGVHLTVKGYQVWADALNPSSPNCSAHLIGKTNPAAHGSEAQSKP